MAKLNKMELEALAVTISDSIVEAKLPTLISEWEAENEVNITKPLYLAIKEIQERFPTETKNIINLYQLNASVGIKSKPTSTNCSLPAISSIVNALIIAQITDSNVMTMIDTVKNDFLNN